MMQPSDDIGTIRDLTVYRLETAEQNLKAAKMMYDAGMYKEANNRAYYSVYHSADAVLAQDGRAFKRHKDVIANFNKNYVSTGIFPKDMGRRIGRAEKIRHASDYDDFYIARIDDVDDLIETAEIFLESAKNYCNMRLNET